MIYQWVPYVWNGEELTTTTGRYEGTEVTIPVDGEKFNPNYWCLALDNKVTRIELVPELAKKIENQDRFEVQIQGRKWTLTEYDGNTKASDLEELRSREKWFMSKGVNLSFFYRDKL